MQHYMSLQDIENLNQALDGTRQIQKAPHAHATLGRHKTLGMIFLNPSLRTKLSTTQAAYNLGMNVLPIDFNNGGWPLEFQDGIVMNGGNSEHVKEAAAVIGQYCDIIAIRSFAALHDRQQDQQELVYHAFQAYSGCPIINLESATRHPLQMLADLFTIEQYKPRRKPRVVLSWAPHSKALPHAVVNSFVEGARAMEYDFTITHPPGYELDTAITRDTPVMYDQHQALADADFVYVKNWSSYQHYGQVLDTDPSWRISNEKLQATNAGYVMHCLPVRRNLVMDEAVLESERSIVVPQAKNRLYSAQYVLQQLLESRQ